MKKSLAGLALLMMLLVALSGCAQPPEDVPPDSSAGESTAQQTGGGTEGSVDASESETGVATDTADPSDTSASSGASQASQPGGSTTTPPTSTSTTTRPPIKNPLDVDLKGAEIIVAYPKSDPMYDPFNATASKNSKYINAVVERTKKLEKELNCKIVRKESADLDKLHLAAFNAIMSGERYADIILTTAHQVTRYLTSEMLVDLKSVPTLDLSQSYWKSSVSEISNIKNKTYFASCGANNESSAISMLFFNKRIAKELNFTGANDPYALVKANKWTISKVSSMMKTATRDKDGKPGMSANDQWGMAQLDLGTCGMTSFMVASGARMLIGDNGNVKYNMKDSKVIDTLNQAYNFFVKDGTCNTQSDSVKLFTSGNALFLSSPVGYATGLSNMDDDFGMVPFPRGDSEKDFTGYVDWNSSVFMMLKNAKADNAGAFLQALAYLSPATVGVWREEFSTRSLRDDESMEMLELMEKKLRMDYAQIFGATVIGEVHYGTFQVLYQTAAGKSPKTLVEEFEKSATTKLKETLDKIK